MADIVSVNITGLKELQEALQEAQPKQARLAMRIALSAGGGTVKNAMQQTAPVEVAGQHPGFLRDHIKVKTIVKNGGLTGTALVGPTKDPYPSRVGKLGTVTLKTGSGKLVSFLSAKAGQVTAALVAKFLEFGTSKMSKHPFLTQAYESSKQDALDRIIRKLKDGLNL